MTIKKSIQLFSALAITFSSFSTYSQNKFATGYVVLTNKDTVKGYIKNMLHFGVNEAVTLKKTIDDPQEFHYPKNEIQCLYVQEDNRLYFVNDVIIDKKPVIASELESTVTKKLVTDRIFMEALIVGRVDLLKYVDENRKTHFFFRKDSKITELNYVKYLQYSKIYVFEEYRQQLANLFADCDRMRGATFSLSDKSLIKAFQTYNECTTGTSYVREKAKVRLVPSIKVGGSFNNFRYSGRDELNGGTGSFASKYDYNNTVTPVAGLSLDFSSNKKFKPFVPTIDLTWRNLGNFSADNGNSDPTLRKKFEFSLTYLNFNVGVKSFFARNSSAKPYLKVGMGYRYLLDHSATQTSHTYSNQLTVKNLVKLAPGGFGGAVGIGCSIKNFLLSADLETAHIAASDVQGGLYTLCSTLSLGYQFNSK